MSRFHICFSREEIDARLDEMPPVEEINDLAMSLKECQVCLGVWTAALSAFMERLLGSLGKDGVDDLKRTFDMFVSWDAVSAFGLVEPLNEYVRGVDAYFDQFMKEHKPFLVTFIAAAAAELMGRLFKSVSGVGVQQKIYETVIKAAIDMVDRRLKLVDPRVKLSVSFEEEKPK